MKTIYYFDITSELNGFCVTQSSKWHYGEMPTDVEVKTFTFDEAINNPYFDWGKCLFSKKRYIRLMWTDISVKEEKFVSASNTKMAKAVDCDYSIADLAKKLTAEDFVDWCKDHGINEIKI